MQYQNKAPVLEDRDIEASGQPMDSEVNKYNSK